MYLTSLFGFLAIVTGVLGYLGLGFGTMPELRIFFFIFLIITIVSFVFERRTKRKKYYD